MTRVLLIEDNNDIQEILYSLLSEDHEGPSGFSGTEGLRLFQQEAVDLVPSGYHASRENGDQVLEEIRLHSQTPVIMMTALGDKHLISQYLLAGANDYIVKPFNLDEVAARVTVQLRNQPTVAQEAPSSQKLSFKNLILNPETFELESGEQTLQLGQKISNFWDLAGASKEDFSGRKNCMRRSGKKSICLVTIPSMPNWAISERKLPSSQMRTILKRSGAWVFAWKETSNVGLVLILVVLVLLLGLGYARLLSALKGFAGADSKEASKRGVGYGWPLRSQKKLVALTKQVSDLFDQIERTNRIAFQEKKTLDMAISNIAHDIRTPLTIASGYTLTNHQGRDAGRGKATENCFQSSSLVSKRLESLLEYRRLMEGAIQPRISDVNLSQVPDPAVVPVLW